MPDWRDFVSLEDDVLLAQCDIDRFRASGPGGQKRNKTDSAVRLRHRPSGLEAIAVESRSQHENRARALRRLRLTIALSLRAPVAGTLPADAFDVGRRAPRFLATLATVFDALEANGWRLSDAARALGVTTAALSRFLEHDPEVFRALSERRQAAGLPPLRTR